MDFLNKFQINYSFLVLLLIITNMCFMIYHCNTLHYLLLYQKKSYKNLVPEYHNAKQTILSAQIFVPYSWEETKCYFPWSARIYSVLSNLWFFNYSFKVINIWSGDSGWFISHSIHEILFKYLVVLHSTFFICANYLNIFHLLIIALIVNMITRDFENYLLNNILCNFT